jgi:hypothetical protein
MKSRNIATVAGAAAFVVVTSTAAFAQSAEPTFKGDPSVYKLIFEDANFRVIEGTRAPGVKDKPHGHPAAGVVYSITDCKTKLTGADGTTRESVTKAGTAQAVPVIPSHTAENIDTTACKQVFVEKK